MRSHHIEVKAEQVDYEVARKTNEDNFEVGKLTSTTSIEELDALLDDFNEIIDNDNKNNNGNSLIVTANVPQKQEQNFIPTFAALNNNNNDSITSSQKQEQRFIPTFAASNNNDSFNVQSPQKQEEKVFPTFAASNSIKQEEQVTPKAAASNVKCDLCGYNFDDENFLHLHKALLHSENHPDNIRANSNYRVSQNFKHFKKMYV